MRTPHPTPLNRSIPSHPLSSLSPSVLLSRSAYGCAPSSDLLIRVAEARNKDDKAYVGHRVKGYFCIIFTPIYIHPWSLWKTFSAQLPEQHPPRTSRRPQDCSTIEISRLPQRQWLPISTITGEKDMLNLKGILYQ
uniref:uncharacterized protein LOC117607700 n=1 Tax=Osmia lignaria TaxID=473952 RepID=UPI001478C528|nr:uncharacterized protein LOC117607700 [Osmia lignaria]